MARVVVIGSVVDNVVAATVGLPTAAITWLTVDLFDRKALRKALRPNDDLHVVAGAMGSLARLTQARSSELQYLCIDNVARAAAGVGLVNVTCLVPARAPSWIGADAQAALATYGATVNARRLPMGARTGVPHGRSLGVRSVQRLPLPPNRSIPWLVERYFAWLPTQFGTLLTTTASGAAYTIGLRGAGAPLLELAQVASDDPTLVELHVVGGVLADTTGPTPARFEFRMSADTVSCIAALHDFVPRLPWMVYVATQANLHIMVMARFARHLAAQVPA